MIRNMTERKFKRRQNREKQREAHKKELYAQYDNYDAIFTYEHLLKSAAKCLLGVSWKASVQKFAVNFRYEISLLAKQLAEGKFKIENVYEFDLFERGKRRHIRSVGIRERVVQRCLCDYSLVPRSKPTLIYDNGASMKGKGVGFTKDRLYKHLQNFVRRYNDGYVLVFDFQKYFESIPHELIIKILDNYYSDQRIKDLIMMFVKCSNPNNIGIDLGSQVSQTLALAAASLLDHYIKEVLRCKYYARYMDDGYIFCESKEELLFIKRMIEDFVENTLHMKLSAKKTKIVKLSKGFVFLKNRYKVDGKKIIITPVKTTTTVMRRKMKKFPARIEDGLMTYEDAYQSYQSWKSHLKGSNCYWTIKKMDALFDSLFIDTFIVDYDRWEWFTDQAERNDIKLKNKKMEREEQMLNDFLEKRSKEKFDVKETEI